MKLSIITCSYNNEKWLKNHLQSVNSQTYKNYEHIIINDNSTDSSLDIIKENVNSEKTKVFLRSERCGAIRNHILGLKQATGDIIVHLDGDDWFYDSTVLDYVVSKYKDTLCWATYGNWVHSDSSIGWGMGKHRTHIAEDLRKLREWNFTHLRTFKRDLISAIPAMDIFDIFGNIHSSAADVAILTGIYEYALKHNKVEYIDRPMVVYNSNTGQNDHIISLHNQAISATQVFQSPYSVLKLI